jgi:hypothetical protein
MLDGKPCPKRTVEYMKLTSIAGIATTIVEMVIKPRVTGTLAFQKPDGTRTVVSTHTLLRITLSDGDQFALDPTRIQFGLVSPVMPLIEYNAANMLEQRGLQVL